MDPPIKNGVLAIKKRSNGSQNKENISENIQKVKNLIKSEKKINAEMRSGISEARKVKHKNNFNYRFNQCVYSINTRIFF